MLAQKSKEEQKQNCKQSLSQEILNWMKIIFYLALSLGSVWTFLYFLSIKVVPEVGNFQNFLFYILIVFSMGLLIIVLFVFISILPSLLFLSLINEEEKIFLINLKIKNLLTLIKIIICFIVYLCCCIFYLFLFYYFYKSYFKSILFLFVLGTINSAIGIVGISTIKFKKFFIKFFLILLILILTLLIFEGDFILKRSFQILKLGSYNAILIINKKYLNDMKLFDYCDITNASINATVLSSIGSEYIIKCKKYIIKIPKEKVSSVILKENENNKSQKSQTQKDKSPSPSNSTEKTNQKGLPCYTKLNFKNFKKTSSVMGPKNWTK